jgi:hypothetical protein
LILMISLPAAIMFFSTGGIILEQYHQSKNSSGHLIAAGLVCFINGLTYLCDFALTVYNHGDSWPFGS